VAAPETMSSPGHARVHRDAPRVRHTYPGWAALLGLALAAAGAGIVWYHGEARPRQHALAALLVGINFLILGGYLALLALRSAAYRARAAGKRHSSPWLYEHAWARREADDGTRGRALHAFAAIAAIGFFLAPFHLIALSEPDWILWLVIGLFDVALAIGLGYATYLLLRHLKFGRTRVAFSGFPLLTGSTLPLRFHGGRPLQNRQGMKAELVCIEEYYETRGSGKDRSQHVVHEALYRDAREFATDASGAAMLEFQVPAHAPGTRFAVKDGERPRYWELEVSAAVPGIDYHGIFLLPVYARP